MDSSPDLSVKLRRGSSDSRDSFYMGFAQGIDSDIEEVTAPHARIPSPPLYPPPEEPPINLSIVIDEPESYEPEDFGMEVPLPVTFEHEQLPESDVNVYEHQQSIEDNDDEKGAEVEDEDEKIVVEEEPSEVTIPDAPPPPPPNEFSESNIEEQISVEDTEEEPIPPPPPAQFILPKSSSIQIDEDEDETITSVTVIPTKSKTPSSSSSSISSNEYIIDESNIDVSQIIPPPSSSPLKTISPPPKPLETDFDAPISPKSIKSPSSARSSPSAKSPPSKKSNASRKSPSISSLSQKSQHSHKSSPKSHQQAKSPPRKLEFHIDERQRQVDSDSIDSINPMDCKIDDDNRDSSPTDSMPPAPTPPPLEPLTLLEKSGIMDATSQVLVPSPSSPDNVIVSPETLSHHSSPARGSRVLHYAAQHVTIDERLPSSLRSSRQHLIDHSRRSTPSSPPPPFQSGPMTPAESSQAMMPVKAYESETERSLMSPATATSTTQHLAVLYETHHHLHPILTSPMRRPSRLPDTSRFLMQQQALGMATTVKEIKALDAFCTTLSALYGKILVVMGIAFPMAEVISTYIPPSFYEGFYLYLYIGSMLFLLFMYATLLWGNKPAIPITTTATTKSSSSRPVDSSSSSDSGDQSDQEESSESPEEKRKPSSKTIMSMRRPSVLASAAMGTQHYGSFYLRMGAVAFGIGSMIYSGLEFGQYFELERDTKCHNVLLALTPATRMAFIFIQMYFIFLNNEQIKVYRYKMLARFGLMHMIGTNLSVWFSVLIQETKHEILTFYDPENRTLKISHRLGNKVVVQALAETHLRVARGLKGPHNIFECRRSNILGNLVQDASPFLFPCTIEYSLICAAILYVMWRNISRPEQENTEVTRSELHPFKRSPHHYSVDCANAHKGLFIGILILVLTIISLILFFVLISKEEFTHFAVTEVNICELTLYATTTGATLVGMVQVRALHYDASRSFSLDDILLVGAQSGSFLYSTFTIIGAHLTLKKNTVLILITALASLIETAFQTMFILDASRRSAATPDHVRKKPGREIVTFLLVSNLAMWAINTLEKSRAESHPLQLHFYGVWAWTIITHVSMPLAIFYRFHSTVCLCDIWKRAWKMKPAYM
ncbi:proton channel OtopLc isoform X2 [Chironomus tepperi]|uniref:proton channel OtopLc isoform X2 n=1 Tax=Chironomus tepperi TaxID=113505 RepID=UPI00391F0A44